MRKIGFISPYRSGCDIAKKIAEEVGVEIVCDVAVAEEAVSVARRMFEEGVSAIVDRYPTSTVLVEIYGEAIVEIPLSNYAMIQMLAKARKYGRRIAYITLAGKGDQGADLDMLQNLLDIEIEIFPMQANGDQEDTAQRIRAANISAAVSAASCMMIPCRAQGINLFLIPLDEESLRQGIKAAASIAEIKDISDKMHAFLDNESHGILLVSEDGTINVFNQTLSKLLGLDESRIVGRTLTEAAKLSPQLRSLSEGKHVFKVHDKIYYVASFHYADAQVVGTAFKVMPLEQDETQVASTFSKNPKGIDGFKAQYKMQNIIGNSPAICQIKRDAEMFAQTDSTILITGESGTGKELFAQAIHNASKWRDGPFVALNCAALPENLFESELYGYVDGAFTGARRGGKVGLFELSQGGTLFLDEIGEIPLSQQSRLLRSLQEKQIIRLGGTKAIHISNRIICATNRNLLESVEKGQFRSDLYYRINVLNLDIPPLRERSGDISALMADIGKRYTARDGGTPIFSREMARELEGYEWPGNVRELSNFLESVAVTSPTAIISEEHFNRYLMRRRWPQERKIGEDALQRAGTLRENEAGIILKQYEACAHNVQATADALGISRTTLWRKLKKLQEER